MRNILGNPAGARQSCKHLAGMPAYVQQVQVGAHAVADGALELHKVEQLLVEIIALKFIFVCGLWVMQYRVQLPAPNLESSDKADEFYLALLGL